jgi:hypothetical protein
MKLVILLDNSEEEAAAISSGLRETAIKVECEAGKVVLVTDNLVPNPLDLNNHELIRETWNRARELVSIMNGVSRVEPGTVNEIALSNLAYITEDGQRRYMPITARSNGVLSEARSTSPDAGSFIALALADHAAAKALRLFSDDCNWPNLYRIYEVIEDSAQPGIVQSGWATKAELQRFTKSANNPSISGDASRHGKTNTTASPAHGMSRAAATDLVARILRQWLDSRVTRLRAQGPPPDFRVQ